jgi:hypothetical protein
LLASLLGAILLAARPARAVDEDTAYALAGAALLSLIVCELSHDNGSEFGEQLEQYAAVLAPWLVGAAEAFLNDADTRAAAGDGNVDLAVLALNYLAPRLANRNSELAGGAIPLHRIYDYGRRDYPVEFAMIYRESTVGGVTVAAGLWPRLDAWLRDKGYLGTGARYAAARSGGSRVQLTDEDRDELIGLAARAIVEEYYAVRYGERISVSVSVAPEGLDAGGE